MCCAMMADALGCEGDGAAGEPECESGGVSVSVSAVTCVSASNHRIPHRPLLPSFIPFAHACAFAPPPSAPLLPLIVSRLTGRPWRLTARSQLAAAVPTIVHNTHTHIQTREETQLAQSTVPLQTCSTLSCWLPPQRITEANPLFLPSAPRVIHSARPARRRHCSAGQSPKQSSTSTHTNPMTIKWREE